jgi:hypothetical protein
MNGLLSFAVICCCFFLQSCEKIDSPADAGKSEVKPTMAVYNKSVTVPTEFKMFYPSLKSASLTQVVTNGGFESYFTGWQVSSTNSGLWFVDDFDPNPAYHGMPHAEPLAHSGNAGAGSVETGPTHLFISQDVTLPNGQVELRFWIRWKNFAELWIPGNTGSPVQNIQVNIRDVSTDAIKLTVFDAALMKLPFYSGGGNYTTANYEYRTADISAYAGQNVRLEFRNDNDQLWMFMDLDDIEIVQISYPAQLDIMPGNMNEINLKSKGNVPVALLSDENFDATKMDLSTITLGNDIGEDTHIAWKNNGTFQASFEDVNGDGLLDLMMHFDMGKLITHGDLVPETKSLKLNGFTMEKLHVIGQDEVIIII